MLFFFLLMDEISTRSIDKTNPPMKIPRDTNKNGESELVLQKYPQANVAYNQVKSMAEPTILYLFRSTVQS
ncbi:hypothetical protein D3C71_703150 [compost metagenome]